MGWIGGKKAKEMLGQQKIKEQEKQIKVSQLTPEQFENLKESLRRCKDCKEHLIFGSKNNWHCSICPYFKIK